MKLKVDVELDEASIAKMQKAWMMLNTKITDDCAKALAGPIVARAKQLAPSSRKTGTRKKWGKRVTKYFNPTTWAQDDSGKHMASKVQKTARGAWVIVGGKSPRANKLNFNSNHEKGRKMMLWGKDSGKVYKAPTNFMKRAFDETRSAQLTSFNSALDKALKEAGLG